MFIAKVDPEPPHDVEVYLFSDEKEVDQFRDHIRDLYGLDISIEIHDPMTYDEAIEAFMESNGPSKD